MDKQSVNPVMHFLSTVSSNVWMCIQTYYSFCMQTHSNVWMLFLEVFKHACCMWTHSDMHVVCGRIQTNACCTLTHSNTHVVQYFIQGCTEVHVYLRTWTYSSTNSVYLSTWTGLLDGACLPTFDHFFCILHIDAYTVTHILTTPSSCVFIPVVMM